MTDNGGNVYPKAGTTSQSGISFTYPEGWTVKESFYGPDTGATYDIAVLAPSKSEDSYPGCVYMKVQGTDGMDLEQVSKHKISITHKDNKEYISHIDLKSNKEDQSLGGPSRTVKMSYDDTRYGKISLEAHFRIFDPDFIMVEYKAKDETFANKLNEANTIINSTKYTTK